MKRISILMSIMLMYFSIHAQNVITVNSNPGADADFSKLQAAIDDTNTRSGDTIYISGSAEVYGFEDRGVIINKQLTIIGPGYFLANNLKTQNNKLSATIYNITIGEGSDGTVIMGVTFSNYLNIESKRRDGSSGTNEVKNIRIERNYISTISSTIHDKSYDITISKNYIENTLNLDSDVSNVLISNNIFQDGNVDGWDVNYANVIVSYNTFLGNFNNNYIRDLKSVKIENNILIDTHINDCDNSDIFNNVFVSPEELAIASTSTGNNLSENIFGVVKADLFNTIDPSADDLVYDNELVLGPNSAALGAGRNGEDTGAFGGNDPYILSGIPPIPSIYDLSTSGVGNSQTGLNITIKVKSNQ